MYFHQTTEISIFDRGTKESHGQENETVHHGAASQNTNLLRIKEMHEFGRIA
jgi:hypothetical protein